MVRPISPWKRTLAVCAALLTLSFAAASGAERGDDGAVVVLAAGPTSDGIGAGTVVALSGTTIRVLTAKHVATYGTPSVRFADGSVVPAHLQALVPGQDLAVLEAQVDPARAATQHVATIARPRAHARVHLWGSGYNGPALESGVVAKMASELPDGPANARYALECKLCHRGDSGAGIFDEAGRLVGVFVGYFTLDVGRVSIAETPSVALAAAPSSNGSAPKLALSNNVATPAAIPASGPVLSTTDARSAASTSMIGAPASSSGRARAIVPAAANPFR